MLTHNQIFLSEYVRTPQMSKINAYVLAHLTIACPSLQML